MEKIETKKRKHSETENDAGNKCLSSIFKDFKLIKVLREDARHKLITLHGTMPIPERDTGVGDGSKTCENHHDHDDHNDAVVILERNAFNTSSLVDNIRLTETLETLHNDIYSTHNVFNFKDIVNADIKATVICPATDKHIIKYSEHEPFIIHETQHLYNTVTLPCIQNSNLSLQWVYNILEKKKEADRIIVDDPDPDVGFVMVPDMKWDRKHMDALYAVAIVHKHGIKSIRDLRGEHLPLLENILKLGQTAIKEKFNVTSDKLRVYFHYQPSYYHLHVHFTHVKFDAPGSDVLRAHLIQEVMDNIAMDSEYYKNRTLSFVVRENDLLYQKYKDSRYFS
ncbi:m7GpppX diphosphatase [Biomphalaria glabrata]|nr:m7GpppX diphosphatase-like; partial [Biomphalaria glabrata]